MSQEVADGKRTASPRIIAYDFTQDPFSALLWCVERLAAIVVLSALGIDRILLLANSGERTSEAKEQGIGAIRSTDREMVPRWGQNSRAA